MRSPAEASSRARAFACLLLYGDGAVRAWQRGYLATPS